MFRTSYSRLVALSWIAMAFAVGCGGTERKDHNDIDEIRAALDTPGGGITTESEPVDQENYADISTLDSFADSAIVGAPDTRLLTFLMVWGHLPRPDGVDPSASTDWSGTIRVTGGKLSLDRTILLEPGDQVNPRTDETSLSFVSHTLPAVDGLLMHVRQENPDAKLVFDSRATKLTINLASVSPELTGLQPLPDRVNGVAFYAYEDRPGCADGFLFGRYRRLSPDVGKFHLRVADDHGQDIGRVRGIYGHARRLNENVFFGKLVDLTGQFEGRLFGSYGDGVFSGEWRYDSPTASGVLRGRYWEGRDAAPGRGLAIGHWSEACPAN